MPAEDFVSQTAHDFDLFYLDPPYTAQQYSRFYHILETLVSYTVPRLFHDGRLTTGLYPVHRYKSSFCSKTKALPALGKIIGRAKDKNISLLISYSSSAKGSNGNSRMISFNTLLETCVEHYGHSAVEWREMRHRYRQFNSAGNSNDLRNDPELLVACRTH